MNTRPVENKGSLMGNPSRKQFQKAKKERSKNKSKWRKIQKKIKREKWKYKGGNIKVKYKGEKEVIMKGENISKTKS